MSNIIAETNDYFSHNHFELLNFILARKLTVLKGGLYWWPFCNFHFSLLKCLILSQKPITKKEPKSDSRVSKFDWHDLAPIFLAVMLPHNLKVFWKPIKHHLLVIH